MQLQIYESAILNKENKLYLDVFINICIFSQKSMNDIDFNIH